MTGDKRICSHRKERKAEIEYNKRQLLYHFEKAKVAPGSDCDEPEQEAGAKDLPQINWSRSGNHEIAEPSTLFALDDKPDHSVFTKQIPQLLAS